MKRKKFIVLLMIILNMYHVICAYAEDINLDGSNNIDLLQEEQTLLISTRDEETGETICTEILMEHVNTDLLYLNNVKEVSNSIDSGVSTYGVIGEDTRIRITDTTQYPYSAICFIEANFDFNNDGVIDWYGEGSGSLIGPNTVATAAHVIYNSEHDVWASYVKVYPGKNGTTNPYGYAVYSNMLISGKWNSTYNFPSEEDWGLIELSSPLGNSCGYLGLSESATINMNVNLTGYHGDLTRGTMWKSTGVLTSVEDNYIRYNCDMMPGASGSPIYDNSNQLIGINAYGQDVKNEYEYTENSGPRLTNYLYQYFRSACVQYGKPSPGCLDSVTTSNIGGWSIDSNNPYDQKEIHVYVRNNSTEELVNTGKIIADDFRSDIGLHGFNYGISWLKIKPGNYRVDTYAIGINGSNPKLNNSGIIYTVEQSTGVVDSVSYSNGIKGWVWKPDAPNSSIQAHIYIYDSSNNQLLGKSVTANAYRSDLVAAGKGNGYHGFTYNVDWDSLPNGTLTVKVYAVDGSGTNPRIYTGTYNNN